ncbi:hypothetical protein [Amycolatopsis sp. lyj-346]|uniref:hypothetical protein n=1 Tax=Amycolatopsis sp. lyj-346 TaxID=2789289 RepID=UPI0039798810
MTFPASDLTTWHYTCGHREGTMVTGTHGDRAALADAVISPGCRCEADGRAAVAGAFDRLPGLTLAVVPIRSTGLLLGDRRGDTILAGYGEAEAAAVAACVWLTTGRPLNALTAISGMACHPDRMHADAPLLFLVAGELGGTGSTPAPDGELRSTTGRSASAPTMRFSSSAAVDVAERRPSSGDWTSALRRNSRFRWRCLPPRRFVP